MQTLFILLIKFFYVKTKAALSYLPWTLRTTPLILVVGLFASSFDNATLNAMISDQEDLVQLVFSHVPGEIPNLNICFEMPKKDLEKIATQLEIIYFTNYTTFNETQETNQNNFFMQVKTKQAEDSIQSVTCKTVDAYRVWLTYASPGIEKQTKETANKLKLILDLSLINFYLNKNNNKPTLKNIHDIREQAAALEILPTLEPYIQEAETLVIESNNNELILHDFFKKLPGKSINLLSQPIRKHLASEFYKLDEPKRKELLNELPLEVVPSHPKTTFSSLMIAPLAACGLGYYAYTRRHNWAEHIPSLMATFAASGLGISQLLHYKFPSKEYNYSPESMLKLSLLRDATEQEGDRNNISATFNDHLIDKNKDLETINRKHEDKMKLYITSLQTAVGVAGLYSAFATQISWKQITTHATSLFSYLATLRKK